MNLIAIRNQSGGENDIEEYVALDNRGYLYIANTYLESYKFPTVSLARDFIRENWQILSQTFNSIAFIIVQPDWSDTPKWRYVDD